MSMGRFYFFSIRLDCFCSHTIGCYCSCGRCICKVHGSILSCPRA
jgi:hypothetical protein